MARGTFQITNVQDDGGGQYILTIAGGVGIAPGDHAGARLASGFGAIYDIIAVSGGTITVTDTLTEAEPGVFGKPTNGLGAFGTPEPALDLTQLPFNAPGWDAMVRRNYAIIDVGGSGGETGATGATGLTGQTGQTGPGATQSLAETLLVGNETSEGSFSVGGIIISDGDTIIFEIDNQDDIGSEGSFPGRPRKIFVGTEVVVGDDSVRITEDQVLIGSNGSGSISIPGGLTSTHGQQFGPGASASGIFALAVGRNATANFTNATAIGDSANAVTNCTAIGRAAFAGSLNDSTAIGSSAVAANQFGVAIGSSANCNALRSVVIGAGASISSSANFDSVVIGRSASGAGINVTAVGRGAAAAGTAAIAFGAFAVASTNQCAIASDTAPIFNLYFNSITAVAPKSITIHSTSASGGSGGAGADLELDAGVGDGAGVDGDLIFSARGGSVTFNEAGQESLSVTNFGASSIVGALNELAAADAPPVSTLAAVLAAGNSTGGIAIGNTSGIATLLLQSGTGAMTFTAGGIFDVNATGAITLASNENCSWTASGPGRSINLVVTGGGLQEVLLDSAGTGGDAIRLRASAGGIDMLAETTIIISSGVDSALTLVSALAEEGNSGTVTLGAGVASGTVGTTVIDPNGGGVDIGANATTVRFLGTSTVTITDGVIGVGIATDIGLSIEQGGIATADGVSEDAGGDEFNVATGSGSGIGAGGFILLETGNGGATDGSVGGAITLVTGGSAATNGDSGPMDLDVGAATGSGTVGTLSLGATNADTITVGSAGTTTSFPGANTITILNGIIGGSTANFVGFNATSFIDITDNGRLIWGLSNDSEIRWSTAQTNDSLMWGIKGGSAAQSSALILFEESHAGADFLFPIATDPTFVVFSRTAPGVATDEFVAMKHNVTSAELHSGSGGFVLSDGGDGVGDATLSCGAITTPSLDGITTLALSAIGASADLTLGARGGTITLNEAGQESLLTTSFTATSIIGALNELVAASGVSTLAQTLAVGNTTGGTDLIVTSGDAIDAATAVPLVLGPSAATAVTIGASGTAVGVVGRLNVGTTTSAATQGDFAAGLTGSGNSVLSFDQSTKILSLLPTDDATVCTFQLGQNNVGGITMFTSTATSGGTVVIEASGGSTSAVGATIRLRGGLGDSASGGGSVGIFGANAQSPNTGEIAGLVDIRGGISVRSTGTDVPGARIIVGGGEGSLAGGNNTSGDLTMYGGGQDASGINVRGGDVILGGGATTTNTGGTLTLVGGRASSTSGTKGSVIIDAGPGHVDAILGTIDIGITNAGAINIARPGITTTFGETLVGVGINAEEWGIQTASTELTGLSGSTVTAVGLIPAGSMVIGVTTFVTTAIGGAASYDVGDGSDVDRWGAGITTDSDPTDFIDNTLSWTTSAAGDVVLTANGGNFTSGAVRIIVTFMSLTAPNN